MIKIEKNIMPLEIQFQSMTAAGIVVCRFGLLQKTKVCLEGGYALDALARSVAVHVRVLADL